MQEKKSSEPVLIGEAWESETEVVVLGNPAQMPEGLTKEEQSEWEEASHNCDAMGCGSCHVLFRFRKQQP